MASKKISEVTEVTSLQETDVMPIGRPTDSTAYKMSVGTLLDHITTIIPQGPPGPQGAKGDVGVGITNVGDNLDGTLTLEYGDGHFLTTGNLTGPQGVPGIQGVQGPTGPTGPTGNPGYVLVSAYASLTAAVAAIGSTVTNLLLDVPTTCTANTTIPATLSIQATKKGTIDQGSYTLTINGPFEAGGHQVFMGSGSVVGLMRASSEWWGAVGDGTTDDTAALQKLVTALVPGGTFVFRANTSYKVTNLNFLQSGITIEGNGAHIYGDTHGSHFHTSAYPGSLFRIGYYNTNIDHITVRNLNFHNTGTTTGTAGDAGYYTTLNGVSVTYNRRQNKQINTDAAIWTAGSRQVLVENCNFYEVGVAVLSEDTAVTGLTVRNCYIKDWGSVGVFPTADSVIDGNIFEQNAPVTSASDILSDLGTSHAIYVTTGFDNVKVINNTIYRARVNGVQFNSSSQFNDAIVSGNTLISCTYSVYIGGAAAHTATISTNIIRDCGPIRVESPSAVVRILSNSFIGSVYASIPSVNGSQIVATQGMLHISGNSFSGYTGGSNQAAINIIPAPEIIALNITGNTFLTDGKYALYLSSASAASVINIANNDFYGTVRIQTTMANYLANTTFTGNNFYSPSTGIAQEILSSANGLQLAGNMFVIPNGIIGVHINANNGSEISNFMLNTFKGVSGGVAYNVSSAAASSVKLYGNTYDSNVSKTPGSAIAISDTVNTVAVSPATSGTMTVPMSGSAVTITPTGDATFNASGGMAGQRLSFVVTTSGTTSYTLTFGTNFVSTGTLATGTVTAKKFIVSFVCTDGTTWVETGRTIAM